LKIAFKIPPNVTDISAQNLLVEFSNDEISFLIYAHNPFAIQGFYEYQLEKNIVANEYVLAIKEIMADEPILQQAYVSVNVMYNFSTATLVPVAYFVDAEKENMLQLLFGKEDNSYCFQENVKNNDIKLVYRIPSKIYETVNDVFPKNSFAHASSLQLQANTDNALQCIVYHNFIKVILFKEGKLQIVQYFDYEMPIDVSYHLLNVCERFGVSPSSVQLLLSGMIDESSNLKDDIYKYFLNVSFANLPANTIVAENMSELPAHFYSNLTALALCV
jgi:hypothetical protein